MRMQVLVRIEGSVSVCIFARRRRRSLLSRRSVSCVRVCEDVNKTRGKEDYFGSEESDRL